MKKDQYIWIRISAVLLSGAFFTFLLYNKIPSFKHTLIVGYFYALSIYFSLFFVYRFITNKLDIFNKHQQWLLKSFIYTITISFAYLIGLLFQTIILTPVQTISNGISDQLWGGIAKFMSSPFRFDFILEDYGGVIITFFAIVFLISVVSLFGSFIEVRWRENKQKQALAKAELSVLRTQIEPHFLFNTLNTIASTINTNSEKAEYLILELSEMLQYMFKNAQQESVSLEEEVGFTKQYLALMKARFEMDLIVTWREEWVSKQQKVPVFLIQPIVENAIKHSWNDRNKNLKLDIHITEMTDKIRICVQDNGIGITTERLKQIPLPDHALANTVERLSLFFKRKNLLTINSEVSKGTTVFIDIPR